MKKIFGLAFIAASMVACNSETTTSETNIDSLTPPQVVVDTTPIVAAPVVAYTEGDVIRKDGKILVYTNGTWVTADKDVKLDNGVVIKTNGEVRNKEGKVIVMEEGEYVNRTGNFFDRTGAAIENAWDATKRGVSKAADATKNVAEKTGDAIKTGAEKTGDAIKTGAEKTGAALKKGAQKVGDKTKEVVQDIKN